MAGRAAWRSSAAGRLQILDAESLSFDLKTVWSAGTYRIDLSPQEWLEKRADLLRRLFRIDVTPCPSCGAPMKIVAALTERRSIQRYLAGVGLP